MKTRSITRSTALIIGTAVSSSFVAATAFGAGFALNEQSARLSGQAFSGRASDADNASTVFGNPAGMSLLKQGELSAGFTFIDAHSDITNVTSTAAGAEVSGSNDGDIIPFSTIPFAFYSQPIDEHWAAGFGIYTPFGLVTDYDDDFQGRYFGTKSDIRVITLQPTMSYRFDNGLSVGIGVTYNRFDGELKKDIFTPLGDIDAGVKGDDTAWGYNIGALYQFSDNTRVGLTYYSKVKYTLEGHTNLKDVPAALGIGTSARYDAKLDVETPDRIELGLTHILTPQLTLHANIARTNWKTLDEIRVKNEGTPVLLGSRPLAETVEPLDWDPSMFYSLGLSYRIDNQWTVRGGLAIDKQPIPSSTRSVRLPAGDRKIAAIGGTWSPLQNLDIDFSYMYIKEKEVRVNQEGEALGTGLPYSYEAKYDSYVNLLAAQATWRF